jgi:hypothetical protein
MSQVGFEPKIERAKTVHGSAREATDIGRLIRYAF